MRVQLAILALLATSFALDAEDKTVPPEDMGRELRKLIFSTRPADLELKSDAHFPKVYGLVMDWCVGDNVATIVALRDGTASLYTTSTFGIIGGDAHEAVRNAATACTQTAGQLLEGSTPTKDFRYPKPGEVLFYFLTYDGVSVASASEEEIYAETHRFTPLFASAQKVLTQLQQAPDKK